jgi:uncharacterized spore protein YtfJ
MISRVLSIFNNLQDSVKVESAFLDPVYISAGLTIIPVVKKEFSMTQINRPAPGITGGGSITPHSFIIITDSHIKITGFDSFQQDLAGLLDSKTLETVLSKVLKEHVK